MDFKYSTRTVNEVLIFTIQESRLDHQISPYLKEQLFITIAGGNPNIVLDLSKVQEMDSSGLGALLFGKRQANSQNGDLCLSGVTESIQNMIRIAQLSHVFEIYENVQEAVESFRL